MNLNMRVIVAHPNRQYCHQLLLALKEAEALERFFTLFSPNKIARWKPLLPPRLRQHLDKRAVDTSITPYIHHFPGRFLLHRLFDRSLTDAVKRGYEWFDGAVAQRLHRYTFDLIITYENSNRRTLRAARTLGKPTVLDLAQIHHNDIAEYGRAFMTPSEWRREVEEVNPRKEEALGYTDYVFTLSRFAAESMLRHGWPPERLFTIPLGVDSVRFRPKEAYCRQGPLRLLFVGTLTRRKGVALLLEAVRRLPPQATELTLIGPMSDAEDLLRRHSGHFRYLPFLHHDALAEQYRQADLFVFPSLLDSWAQTVLEAMACGTPVVVSQRTGAREAVEQGGGWVVPADDARALAEALSHCLDNRSELQAMGQRAARIAQQYSWEHYRRQVIAVIQQIAART